jgi:hypothetical protein
VSLYVIAVSSNPGKKRRIEITSTRLLNETDLTWKKWLGCSKNFDEICPACLTWIPPGGKSFESTTVCCNAKWVFNPFFFFFSEKEFRWTLSRVYGTDTFVIISSCPPHWEPVLLSKISFIYVFTHLLIITILGPDDAMEYGETLSCLRPIVKPTFCHLSVPFDLFGQSLKKSYIFAFFQKHVQMQTMKNWTSASFIVISIKVWPDKLCFKGRRYSRTHSSLAASDLVQVTGSRVQSSDHNQIPEDGRGHRWWVEFSLELLLLFCWTRDGNLAA